MRLTVVLTDIPKDCFTGFEGMTNVRLGKQSGKEPVDVKPVKSPNHTIQYDVEVRRNKKTDEPDFFGHEVFGTADRRFLYVQWIGDLPKEQGKMFRRLKVDLGGISTKQASADKPLTVDVKGVDKKGAPACATAVVGEWRTV
ncbi:MAG TPA: DUF5990 family protein [Fimbriimonadaceae bacterium]|nr:DUF5990 family protein [Fimbriimonadaceae bacterium]